MDFYHFWWFSHGFPMVFPWISVPQLCLEDLDGVAHLPEIMRPDPEQKPTEIAQPVEDTAGCGGQRGAGGRKLPFIDINGYYNGK